MRETSHNRQAWSGFAPTIFHHDWWLDIACDHNWERAAYIEGNSVLGWLPYAKESRLGFSVSRMPTSTPFLGPALCSELKDDFRAQIRIIRSLLKQLPKFSCFAQKMHVGVQNLLPFQMEGFTTGVQFSFELSGDPKTVWSCMRRRTREVLQSSERTLVLDLGLDLGSFFEFAEANHRTKFGTSPRGLRTTKALAAAALLRSCGSLIGARNLEGRLVGAIMCVSDPARTYYFLSSRSHDAGNAAVSFLLWNAIQNALQRGTVFDFNGVADAGSVSFFSGFSTEFSPRYAIAKTTMAFRLAREARRIVVGPDNVFTNCL